MGYVKEAKMMPTSTTRCLAKPRMGSPSQLVTQISWLKRQLSVQLLEPLPLHLPLLPKQPRSLPKLLRVSHFLFPSVGEHSWLAFLSLFAWLFGDAVVSKHNKTCIKVEKRKKKKKNYIGSRFYTVIYQSQVQFILALLVLLVSLVCRPAVVVYSVEAPK